MINYKFNYRICIIALSSIAIGSCEFQSSNRCSKINAPTVNLDYVATHNASAWLSQSKGNDNSKLFMKKLASKLVNNGCCSLKKLNNYNKNTKLLFQSSMKEKEYIFVANAPYNKIFEPNNKKHLIYRTVANVNKCGIFIDKFSEVTGK